LLGPEEYDVAGAGTGVVGAAELLGADRVAVGEVAIAMGAAGLHSNGYSLARHVLLTTAGLSLEQQIDQLGRTLGEELLAPTRIYSLDVLDLARGLGPGLHAVSHVTGGGLAANLARVLPADIHLVVERSTWTPQPVFDLIAALGSVPRPEQEATFNQGVGMVAVVAAEAADRALERLAARGVPTWVLGTARARDGEPGDAPAKGGGGGAVTLVGSHPSRS
jgi:phosphoribosylformylglycinamidine cyclo-ligase